MSYSIGDGGIAMAVCSTSGAFATFATLTEQARSRRKKGDKAYQTTSCEAAQRQNLRRQVYDRKPYHEQATLPLLPPHCRYAPRRAHRAGRVASWAVAAGKVTQASADNGIDGIINEDPLGLMIEHNLGVSTAQTFALKRLDTDFFEED